MKTVARVLRWSPTILAACALVGGWISSASAETLMMPKRDFLMGVSEVLWGVSDQANNTAYSMDFGDGSAPVTGNVSDRSYIAFNHTYATSGTFKVTLTIVARDRATTAELLALAASASAWL